MQWEKSALADVQQACLQIEIDENHQDFLRFIWFDNVLFENPLLVFARVVFGLTCSPFFLNVTESLPRKVCTYQKLIKVYTTIAFKFNCGRSIK